MANITNIQQLAAKLGLYNLAKQNFRIKEEGIPNLEFLEYVLSKELELRECKRRLIVKDKARFPFDKSLEDFDLKYQQGVTKFMLDELSKAEWVADKYNLLIIGDAGVGKTHLVVGFAIKAIEKEHKVFYTTLDNLLYLIKTQDAINKSRTRLKYINSECKLLILDEVGYLPLSAEDARTVYSFIEEQLNSYKTQVEYYTAFIQSKPEWEFAGIYADEGITGTSKRKRKKFLLLVRDALDGKIDYIICKSVSRFARNTVDILQTVRDLREKGIKIYFEKENIDSLDPKCDMILSIHASMAEEESRSISGNIRLGYKMRREKGIVSLNFNNIYGYNQDKEKNITINEAEADVIRDIYFKYLLGYSYSTIADELTERGILTPLGNETWNLSTIKGILENEKYVGDCLMQKTYKRDIHQPYAVKNKGQAPQKYIDNNHLPIVPRDIWNAVQAERERRKSLRAVNSDSGKGCYDARYAFSGILFCGECGGNFRRHIHYIQGAEVPAWTCKEHLKGKHSCGQSPIKESYLEAVFVRTLNGIIQNRDKIISMVGDAV